ncbi:hypothetical protein DSCA_11160 [Desulfosarcina alkanivorans]|uniref:Uncharacterized protein n=1 Tax=Desulfosarcina alkanivorans TaxID=571177 RepID=A0A5K7YDV4_9BACT|nr:hypothetical protein [Desulfosarcina alkanivorans]BBO67186.1 hypothetical protein DSCA_11160 [Desulfosarcina alkanivorans]
MDFFGVGRFMAKKKLPEVAKNLGLKEKPGSSPRSFNEYSGKFKGHFVKVLPESASVTVFMRHIPNLKLSNIYKTANFDTGDARFDRFFTERTAPPDVGEKIAASAELIEFADLLRRKWKRRCEFIEARFDNVACSMNYGNGHYIPADILEPILSDLVRFADLLNQAANASVKKNNRQP